MKRFIAAIVLVAAGFTAGWQARDFSIGSKSDPTKFVSIERAADDRKQQLNTLSHDNFSPDNNSGDIAVASSTKKTGRIPVAENAADNKETSAQPHRHDSLNSTIELFTTFLNRRQHSQALNLYRETEFRDPNAAVELKGILLGRLKEYLANKQQEYFTDLVNTYLSTYYNDTEVLLLVAEFNARSDYLSEALATYQLIRTYAQGKADRQHAASEMNKFVSDVDKQHSDSGMWYELQIFYELLNQYGLADARHRFRLAEIYATNGYEDLSKNIFQDLLSHPRWGKQAGLRLEAMAENRVPEVSTAAYTEEVPLQSVGNHYLVKAGIGDHDAVNLVIDTGASTTLVSSTGFARLSGYHSFVRLPPRMFNTVNGITRGAVYVVPEFNLGSYKLKDVEVAVVDFEPGTDIDGLLGMNVLRNFRFEIDQDSAALLLEKRTGNN